MRGCESPLPGVGIAPGLCRWSYREIPHTAHKLRNTHYPCYLLDVFSRLLRNTNTSSPKQSAKCRNLLELLQSQPWLRKLFDCCFCACLASYACCQVFQSGRKNFPLLYCQSLANTCSKSWSLLWLVWAIGHCWGVIMARAQSGGTCADHGCPCNFLVAQLWLCSLPSPLTLGWMERELSDLSGLSCPSSIILTLKV